MQWVYLSTSCPSCTNTVTFTHNTQYIMQDNRMFFLGPCCRLPHRSCCLFPILFSCLMKYQCIESVLQFWASRTTYQQQKDEKWLQQVEHIRHQAKPHRSNGRERDSKKHQWGKELEAQRYLKEGGRKKEREKESHCRSCGLWIRRN